MKREEPITIYHVHFDYKGTHFNRYFRKRSDAIITLLVETGGLNDGTLEYSGSENTPMDVSSAKRIIKYTGYFAVYYHFEQIGYISAESLE